VLRSRRPNPEAEAAATAPKPIDDRSTFEIASISKPFTAIAILQFVEQGKIELDARSRDTSPKISRTFPVPVNRPRRRSPCARCSRIRPGSTTTAASRDTTSLHAKPPC
jgi:hypothetical protein